MTYVAYEGPDVVSATLLAKLYDTTLQFSSLQTKLAAADGDREAAIKAWVESTDNAQALKLRSQIEAATARLNKLAEENVETVVLSEDDKAKLAEELTEKRGAINAAYKVIETIIETMSDDKDAVRTSFESIENPAKSNRGRKVGTPGSSLPRISANVTVNGGNLKNELYDSFSKVATALDSDVKDIQLAFAAAAGVSHENIKTVTKPITFEFQPNSNGAVYTLTTSPKERKPRSDSKTARSENSASEESTEETQTDTESNAA